MKITHYIIVTTYMAFMFQVAMYVTVGVSEIPWFKSWLCCICGTFGSDSNLEVWRFMIQSATAKLNVCQLTCIMSISQGIYIQYHLDRQTKCSSICFALQLAKLNVRQMHHVYSRKDTENLNELSG